MSANNQKPKRTYKSIPHKNRPSIDNATFVKMQILKRRLLKKQRATT